MSGRKPNPGASGKSSSKDVPKKEKPQMGRKPSADRGRAVTSLPSSPLNPKPSTSKEAKKTATSVTPRKDPLPKPKAAKKEAEVPVEDLNVEVLGAEGGQPSEDQAFKRLPKGVETGQFVRRARTEVKPVALRPELSPRSRKVHQSACRFMAVKREECSEQRRMETYIMEIFPKLQSVLRKIHELSQGAAQIPPEPPVGEGALADQNDQLNMVVAKAGNIFREFSSILIEARDRVVPFMNRAEKGTSDIDIALREVINDICNFSKDVKGRAPAPRDDRPDDGGDKGGRQEDGGDKSGKPGDGPDGDKGGKPGDDKGGDQGISGGEKGGSGTDQGASGDKGGSGGNQGEDKGSGEDQGGDKGSGGNRGDDLDEGSGDGQDGSGDEQDVSGDEQESGIDISRDYLLEKYARRLELGYYHQRAEPRYFRPLGILADTTDADKLADQSEDEDYEDYCMESPDASESEPEVNDSNEDYERYAREMDKMTAPVCGLVRQVFVQAMQNPERRPEIFEAIRKAVGDIELPLKDHFTGPVARSFIDCMSSVSRVADPETDVVELGGTLGKLARGVFDFESKTEESTKEKEFDTYDVE